MKNRIAIIAMMILAAAAGIGSAHGQLVQRKAAFIARDSVKAPVYRKGNDTIMDGPEVAAYVANHSGSIDTAAYGEFARVGALSLVIPSGGYATMTGDTTTGLLKYVSEVGDSCLKILSGGNGVYKITYVGDQSINEEHFYTYIFINNIKIEKSRSRLYSSGSGSDISGGFSGQALVRLKVNDIVRLRVYDYFGTSQTSSIASFNLIIERIDR